MALIISLQNRSRSWTWSTHLCLPEGRGREWDDGMDWELGVNGCKLLLLEWISNEILLCGTENCLVTYDGA